MKDEISALAVELAEGSDPATSKLAGRIAALSVREQAELALRIPARQRLDLLLHVPKPMRLVRALPDSEFYLTVREIGPADALPVVSLGSAVQLHHLLDLESWRKDRFDADRAGAWVALLLEAGQPALRRFLRTADDELLALLFQRWIRVQAIVSDEDPAIGGTGHTEIGDETGLVSPDGYYRFLPTIKDHAPAVRRIAQIFFHDDAERYSRIVWSALYELPSALEEEALRWRQSRLEEHGFPPWEEALGVYAAPEKVHAHPRTPSPSDPDGLRASRSPLRVPTVRDRLGAVLDQLDDDERERALHELVGLANHLLVADGGDTGEPAAYRAALEKAGGGVTIALEARGVVQPTDIRRTLAEIPLIELFREGHARASAAQQRARAMLAEGWAAGHGRAVELLDSPVRERVQALLHPRPLYAEIGDEGAVARPFRTLGEVDETMVALELAELLGRLMFDHVGLDLEALLRAGEAEKAELPRFSTLLLTMLAWNAVRGELRGAPLPEPVVSDFLREVASRRTAGPDASARAFEQLTEALMAAFDLDRRSFVLLHGFGRACVERLLAECSSLDPSVPLDPGVSCLLVER